MHTAYEKTVLLELHRELLAQLEAARGDQFWLLQPADGAAGYWLRRT